MRTPDLEWAATRRRIAGRTHLVADVAVIVAFATAPLVLPLVPGAQRAGCFSAAPARPS
jgi:hypothetical protein